MLWSVPTIQSLQSALYNTYGHTKFRPGQLDATLHDIFVLMSTGAGKSLCIFLPPLAMSSSCMGVVTSPFIDY